MPRRFSTDEVTRALERIGFRFVRQRGSHMHYVGVWRGSRRRVTLVAGQSQIPAGTMGRILQQAALSVDELKALIERRTIIE